MFQYWWMWGLGRGDYSVRTLMGIIVQLSVNGAITNLHQRHKIVLEIKQILMYITRGNI